MTKGLKILHLEDLLSDAELVHRELVKSGLDCEVFLVRNKTDFLDALVNYKADIILSDHSLPSMNSHDALQFVKEHHISIPFILITATISEEYAVEIMKMGAYDYILKDRLQRLPHAIEMAMTKWRGEKEKEIHLNDLIQSERKFRGLIENGEDLISLSNETFNITYRSPNYPRITGWTSEELGSQFNRELIHPEDQANMSKKISLVREKPGQTIRTVYRLKHKAGHYLLMEGTMTNLLHDPSVKGIVSNFRDVTERKKAEDQLQQSRYLLNKATEMAHIGYFTADAATMTGYWSDEVCRIYGIEPGTFDGSLDMFVKFIHEKDRAIVLEKINDALQGKAPYRLDHRIVRPDGAIRWVHHNGQVSFLENGMPDKIIGITQEVTEQKAMEEILREYNDRFEIVSKATNDAIWDWDIEQDIVLWNHGIETIFGYDLRKIETTNRWWADKVHPADYSRVLSELNSAFEKGETNWFSEYEYKCADGGYKHVLDRAYVIYQGRKPIRMIGAMQDITLQKRAMEEIEKLSLVASKTNTSVIITDPAGKIEWVNNAFSDLTGYSAAEAIGTKPGELLQGPDTNKVVVKRISDKLRRHKSISEEILNYSKSGRKFWVRLSITPIFSSEGRVKHFIAVMTDVTERKEFEVKITTIAKELTSIIENANVPIFGIDRNGNVNEWNKVTVSLSAYSKKEAMRKKWVDLLDPQIHDKVNEVIGQALMGSPVSNYELPFTNKGGKRIILLISISPRRDVNNNIVGLICLGQDLTEVTLYRRGLEKLVEERTRDLNAALQKEKELVEMKSKFISIASHEFRTPLSTITLATGFIKKYKEKVTPEDLIKKLDNIEKQVSHMTYLLDDVLTVGKAEAGKLDVTLAPIEITFFKNLADEVIKSAGTHHKLKYKEDCHTTSIFTSEKLIRNIIINLITNAIKFSPGEKEVFLSLHSNKERISITVKDFGIGIPDADLKNLFTSFSRGSNVGVIEGTGLGLSIVKKAVEVLKGDVTVKSKLLEGTEFIVTLPL